MTLDLSFKQVCDIIKKDQKDNHNLIEAIDKLLGFTLICSTAIIGPAAMVLLPIITAKNELKNLGKSILDAISSKKDEDYMARQQRMQVAYGLVCFTAFFEALGQQIPEGILGKIGLLREEKVLIARSARGKSISRHETSSEDTLIPASSNHFAELVTPFPHPTETLEQQISRLTSLWKQMGQGFCEVIQKQAFWKETQKKEQAQILKGIEKIPQVAADCFEAQYFELARSFEDFAIWANLQEHKKTKALIGSFSQYVQQHADLVKSAKTAIDIGFTKLNKTVLSIPEILNVSQAEDIFHSLKRHYKARMVEPIAEEKDEPQADKSHLSFPRVCDAFIPQSFQVFRWTTKIRSLEDEATWKGLEKREDLGAFLLSFLSSPYSTETPMVVLGHPGSGKSLLTKVLSAQLMSKQYTAIRVPLREVNAEAGIVGQIEEIIHRITNIGMDSWVKLSSAFKNSPPIVILDGYDELLQASGKVFSAYLKDVQTFQKNEAEQGRPVRVIVTSRVTLIDKATIPLGATITRLLEFDKRQRDRWILIWNRANMNYFKMTNIKEFALPTDKKDGAAKILSLAEQPLLLLMLALYDSQDNQLRKSESLDRTILYDSLLRRFVSRERAKDRKFEELLESGKKKELDTDMQRLAVAALGMYNRRKLHILSHELNDDIKFFSLERAISDGSGRSLTQADLLLGSFFFVHKSQAQHRSGALEHHEETAAFEFLHNTFGEFLTADFILRQALTEVAALKGLEENDDLRPQLEQRLGSADGLSRAWFASLVYTPLFTRPVVLEMMREWIGQSLKRRNLAKQEFLSYLDKIILNQLKRLLSKREMPSIIRKETAQEGYRAPFGDHPLLGHIAIYSINLILLRIIVSDGPFIFDENQISTHEDGARPWDRLTHIWRAWFSLDNLNGVTAVMLSERKESQISVRTKKKFQVAESQNRLQTCLNVGVSLADNISSGLTGLLLFEPSKDNQLSIEDIAERLNSEKINVEFQIAMKQLFQNERRINLETAEEFVGTFRRTLEMALRDGKYEELEQICLTLRRAIKQLNFGASGRALYFQEKFDILRKAIHPEIFFEVARQNPHAAFVLMEIVKEMPDSKWKHMIARDFNEIFLHKSRLMEIMLSAPDILISWIQLVREFRGGGFFRHMEQEFFEQVFHHRNSMKMMEQNPEMMLNLVQLVREVVGEDFFLRLTPEFFARIFHPDYFMELTERNPEVALAWIKLARELKGEDFFNHMPPDFFERLFHPRYFMELTERNPEASLNLIQLALEFRGEGFFKHMYPEFFERIFHPDYFMELTERNPEVALAWIKLARELKGEGFFRHMEPEFFERMFHSRNLMELTERCPEITVAWIKLAREFGGEDFIKSMGPEFFERMFNPSYLMRLLQRKPVAFGTILLLARATKSSRGVESILACLSSSLGRLGGIRSILNTLPLSALSDIQWLGTIASDSQFGKLLREWLHENGLDRQV